MTQRNETALPLATTYHGWGAVLADSVVALVTAILVVFIAWVLS